MPNSSNSPGPMRPPDQVTVSTRSVTSSPSRSTGSSSLAIFTTRFQPGFGWKLTKNTPSGSFMRIFVVDASGRSDGTRIAKRAKPSASHSGGFTVTCAGAVAASTSAEAATVAIAIANLISGRLLFDRYGSGLGEQVELAPACLDPQLPIASRLQVRGLDHERP